LRTEAWCAPGCERSHALVAGWMSWRPVVLAVSKRSTASFRSPRSGHELGC
jgi:hypothetical protein